MSKRQGLTSRTTCRLCGQEITDANPYFNGINGKRNSKPACCECFELAVLRGARDKTDGKPFHPDNQYGYYACEDPVDLKELWSGKLQGQRKRFTKPEQYDDISGYNDLDLDDDFEQNIAACFEKLKLDLCRDAIEGEDVRRRENKKLLLRFSGEILRVAKRLCLVAGIYRMITAHDVITGAATVLIKAKPDTRNEARKALTDWSNFLRSNLKPAGYDRQVEQLESPENEVSADVRSYIECFSDLKYLIDEIFYVLGMDSNGLYKARVLVDEMSLIEPRWWGYSKRVLWYIILVSDVDQILMRTE